MEMPFGQFRNVEIKEIPHKYLKWALTTLDLYGDLQQEICDVLGVDVDHLNQLKKQIEFYKRTISEWEIKYAHLSAQYHMILDKQSLLNNPRLFL